VSSECLIVIFAKRPLPSHVKTRLTKGVSAHLGAVTLEQSATIYRAFLQDYSRRFASSKSPAPAVFCLPDRPESKVEEPLFHGALMAVLEAKRDGVKAHSIGAAMSYTIGHFLGQGHKKVLVLGSDLPHMPFRFIRQAFSMLDEQPLVLGNDGGGCYLVAASETPTVLESPSIQWSEGTDFEQIVKEQNALDKRVGVLPELISDIDGPAQLDQLIEELVTDGALRAQIPATTDILISLGAPIHKTEKDKAMKITINGEEVETEHGLLGDLLKSLEIKRQGAAVEINEEVVPRARIDEQPVADGDIIEIVRLVGGG
jgi:thiamine biosynthesis protein ThiS